MYEVIDTTCLSFHGYEPEMVCDTLKEAMTEIGELLDLGYAGERYTIRVKGDDNDWNIIEIDARGWEGADED